MAKMNIGLLTADLNSGNMGCNALCYSAILLLEEVSKLLKCSFNYIIFNSLQIDSIEWYDKLENLSIQVVPPTLKFRSKIKNVLEMKFESLSKFSRFFDSCELFFEISGGDSFSDIYGIQRPKLYAQYHNKAKKRGKSLVFLPQTIGPFKSTKSKDIALKSLSYASHVFVRDPISYENAIAFTSKDKVSRTIDMAFFMDYEFRGKSIDKIQVGINPSGLLWNGGYTGDNQFGLKEDYKEVIFSIIKMFSNKYYEIHLIPHVLHGPFYNVEDDYRVCKLLQQRYAFCVVAPFFYTPIEAKSYISGLDFLVGSRMHCCIAAYSSGVPIYPLAYSRKFEGLFKKELRYPYGAELVSDDMATVLNGLQSFLGKVIEIEKEMPQRLDKLKNYKKAMIEELEFIISNELKQRGAE